MLYLKVRKSGPIRGRIPMPPSKTHSFRALILASLAEGTSMIRHPKLSSDWHQAVHAMRMYGAEIAEPQPGVYQVKGVAGQLRTPEDVINVNNSGTMLAFVAGVAAACPGWTVLTGDESLRKLRKVTRNFIAPLQQLGVTVISTKGDGMAPFVFKGRVNGGVARMDGTGCQPVFSVLIPSALSEKPVELFVDNPGETAYIELLLHWFKKAGLASENVGGRYAHYRFPGNPPPRPFEVTIPLEWSAVGYPLLAAIITPGSEVQIEGMDLSDPYGDKLILDILQQMGADLTVTDRLITARSSALRGIEVDMNALPDQVPTVAVAACFAEGPTTIRNALTARWKECDRISAVCTELRKMGAKVTEHQDGLTVHPDGTWRLRGATLNGYYDHRMVLAFSVAGLGAEGETKISDAHMVAKSFDAYVEAMRQAGADFELVEEPATG